MKPHASYHIPFTALDGPTRDHLLTPMEPGAPLCLMVTGASGPVVLVKVEDGWADSADGHGFREGWELTRLALDLRHGGTAVALAAEVVHRLGARHATAQAATATAFRIACAAPDRRAALATQLVELVTLSLSQTA